jgi:hypothetical protein
MYYFFGGLGRLYITNYGSTAAFWFRIRPELMIDRHNAFQGLLPYLLGNFFARLKLSKVTWFSINLGSFILSCGIIFYFE